MKIFKQSLLLITGIFVLMYIVFGGLIFVYQRDSIYFPDKQDFYNCPGFKDADKININGTRAYFKKNSDKLIVFYHGNAGSACQRANLLEIFNEPTISFLFVEYTGYSNSNDKPTKNALFKNVTDVNGFIQKYNFSSVYVIGESLGSALASYHASLNSNYKLLLISPFYKLANIAKSSYPIYPISFMLLDNYDNSKYVNTFNTVTIIHGEQDQIIPILESKKYFENITSKNKQFISIPGAGHNGLYGIPTVQQEIFNFLKNK